MFVTKFYPCLCSLTRNCCRLLVDDFDSSSLFAGPCAILTSFRPEVSSLHRGCSTDHYQHWAGVDGLRADVTIGKQSWVWILQS